MTYICQYLLLSQGINVELGGHVHNKTVIVNNTSSHILIILIRPRILSDIS